MKILSKSLKRICIRSKATPKRKKNNQNTPAAPYNQMAYSFTQPPNGIPGSSQPSCSGGEENEMHGDNDGGGDDGGGDDGGDDDDDDDEPESQPNFSPTFLHDPQYLVISNEYYNRLYVFPTATCKICKRMVHNKPFMHKTIHV